MARRNVARLTGPPGLTSTFVTGNSQMKGTEPTPRSGHLLQSVSVPLQGWSPEVKSKCRVLADFKEETVSSTALACPSPVTMLSMVLNSFLTAESTSDHWLKTLGDAPSYGSGGQRAKASPVVSWASTAAGRASGEMSSALPCSTLRRQHRAGHRLARQGSPHRSSSELALRVSPQSAPSLGTAPLSGPLPATTGSGVEAPEAWGPRSTHSTNGGRQEGAT